MSAWEKLKSTRRSRTDKMLGGVCGGLGATTGIPGWMWRIVFLISLFCFGVGLIPYVVLWICVPKESNEEPEVEGEQ